jgi:hypothetical protein
MEEREFSEDYGKYLSRRGIDFIGHDAALRLKIKLIAEKLIV